MVSAASDFEQPVAISVTVAALAAMSERRVRFIGLPFVTDRLYPMGVYRVTSLPDHKSMYRPALAFVVCAALGWPVLASAQDEHQEHGGHHGDHAPAAQDKG